MKWTAIGMCLLLAGCTMASNQIDPVKKSDIRYAAKNCSQLNRDASETYAELSARSQANDNQTGEYTDDNVIRIADLKGQLGTITSTMASKGCPAA